MYKMLTLALGTLLVMSLTSAADAQQSKKQQVRKSCDEICFTRTGSRGRSYALCVNKCQQRR